MIGTRAEPCSLLGRKRAFRPPVEIVPYANAHSHLWTSAISSRKWPYTQGTLFQTHTYKIYGDLRQLNCGLCV